MNKNLYAVICLAFLAGMATLSIAKTFHTSSKPLTMTLKVEKVPQAAAGVEPVLQVDPCKRAKIFDSCMGELDRPHSDGWASQTTVCNAKAEKEALVDTTKVILCKG